jgi:hypothetical protein
MRVSVKANAIRKSQITNHKSQITNHKSQMQIVKKQPPPFSWRRLEVVVNAINRKLSVVYEQPSQQSQATQSRLEMELRFH